MPNSYVINTGNGVTRQYVVPFPFIYRSHVTVALDGANSTAFAWLNDGLIEMTTAPLTGVKIRIERNTSPNSILVDYENGSLLDEATLDLANRQNFYLAQEAEDRAQESIAPSSDTNWDAGGKRIKNVGTPTAPDDAATKAYADAAGVAATASATAAAASASTATTQAGIATTQAGIATTQAGIATAKAAEAASYVGSVLDGAVTDVKLSARVLRATRIARLLGAQNLT